MVQEINKRVVVRDEMGYTVLQTWEDENNKLVTGFEVLKPGVYLVAITFNNSEKVIRIEKR